jgi:tetratricopeptide (TPR) repeat protein
LPIIELLKAYFDIEARDERRRMREKVTGKVLGLDEGLRTVLTPLLALLDLPVDDGAWLGLDPSQRRQRTLDAIKRLLLRESQVQPLIVVFEDLHWIDPETQAVLESLVDSLPTVRLLLFVNYRPEYQHGWGSKTYYHQLQIGSLAKEGVDALLDALLGTDPELGPLRNMLIARTAGNPFFLEETVRTLVEMRALAGEPGSYCATGELQTIQIPSAVQTVIAARIDRLPPADKRVLQAAAVIGKDVPYSLLETICSLPESELRVTLATLQAAEFVYEVQLFPELEYTFKHALTQEVAYTGLTAERRRALDTAIVAAIERLWAERLGEHVERLAHHAFRGEAWPKAARYLHQAGAKAVQTHANRQAVANFEQALVALSRQPESRETLEALADVEHSMGSSLLVLGDPEAALVHARQALSAAERLDDAPRVATSNATLALRLALLARALDGLPFGIRALEAAERCNDWTAHVQASSILGGLHWLIGNFLEGRQHLEKGFELVQAELRPGASPAWDVLQGCQRICAWLAFDLVELGEFDRSTHVARMGARTAAASQQFQALAQFAVPWSYVARGEAKTAIPDLEQGLSLCKSMNLLNMAAPYAGVLGRAYSLTGRSADAIALLEEAVARAAANNRANQALWNSFLSEAYLQAGRIDDAETAAHRGIEGARERGEKGDEAWNLLAFAAVLGHADSPDVDGPAAHYRAAMIRGEELSMRPLVARCHLGLGRLYRRSARLAEAREHLAIAAAMLRDMGMRHWLVQAETELSALG